MTKEIQRARRAARLGSVLAAACVVTAGLASGGAAMAGDDTAGAAAAGGMKVYVDPSTGRILPGPPEGPSNALALTPQEQQAYSTSSQGLIETPSPTPGGGYKLNLQGRFQNSLVATIGPDGKPVINHIVGAPAAQQK